MSNKFIDKWFYPGIRLKRWMSMFALGVLFMAFGLSIAISFRFSVEVEHFFRDVILIVSDKNIFWWLPISGVIIFAFGIISVVFAVRRLVRSMVNLLMPELSDKLTDTLLQKHQLKKGPEIVTLGGGTGLSVLLRGLKCFSSNLTAIVTVADDGGSSGKLRDEFNIIPPGDIRNCLVALADTEPIMEKIFQFRFKTGGLQGHNLGNLILTAFMQIFGNVESAMREVSRVLALRGKVLPATEESINLSALLNNGSMLYGESNLPSAKARINKVFIEPAHCLPASGVIEAIGKADIVVLGPGSLYTSIIPPLLIGGVAQAIRASSALKIYICNVMTQLGETADYTAYDHLKAIVDHVGLGVADIIVVNDQPISMDMLSVYASKGQKPVVIDSEKIETLNCRTIRADIIAENNMVRHDSQKLAETIASIIKNERNLVVKWQDN